MHFYIPKKDIAVINTSNTVIFTSKKELICQNTSKRAIFSSLSYYYYYYKVSFLVSELVLKVLVVYSDTGIGQQY